MNPALFDSPDEDATYAYVRANGIDAAKWLLREYVRRDQPETFLPGMTARMMCTFMSLAVDGRPLSEWPATYLNTTHGPELHSHMWDGE